MTAMATLTGASSSFISWEAINWVSIGKHVHRLQMRIAKAIKDKHYGKAKSLQWLMTHSKSAKLLAVKRVVTNQGGTTAGVDGKLWLSNQEKLAAINTLYRRGYQAEPLRRVYIPKKNGKQRPLGIPTIRDRAMQALHLLALEPIAEMIADKNAYGFRPKRSTADAIEQCFKSLAKKHSPQWILEGDIRACFDTISHEWLKVNTPMDGKILEQWLEAGYVEKQAWLPTEAGTPQGGIISPTLLTITMRGLEVAVKNATKTRDKVNVISYADDFVITGATRDILESHVKPAVIAFLQERGLELSNEKTHLTSIHQGFDFLGFNLRKYDNGKLLIKPSKKNVNAFLNDIRTLIKSNSAMRTENLIRLLNPRIRGWANYYRHVVSKDTLHYIDSQVFAALTQWIKKRHPSKSATWMKKTYFRSLGYRNWLFYAKLKGKKPGKEYLYLFTAAKLPIRRHIKIRADATPYDSQYIDYFKQRAQRQEIISKTERRWLANFPDMVPEGKTIFLAGSTGVGFKKA